MNTGLQISFWDPDFNSFWHLPGSGIAGSYANSIFMYLFISEELPYCFHKGCTSFLEKALATHSNTLAWTIPWMEEPGRLQPMGSLRVRHDWVTSLSLSCTGEGNGNPLQYSCPENPRDGETWWAAICGVAQSQTRLKWLSSSSSTSFYCYHHVL